MDLGLFAAAVALVALPPVTNKRLALDLDSREQFDELNRRIGIHTPEMKQIQAKRYLSALEQAREGMFPNYKSPRSSARPSRGLHLRWLNGGGRTRS